VPWVKAWHEKYGRRGLVIIGVHTPETSGERKLANLKRKVAELGIHHAVAQDNDFAIWRAYGVRAWPTVFLIDKRGIIRYRFEGELNWWAGTRHVSFDGIIQQLLGE
jgi:alkyl hydroperoxide reductase subunit AhpC